MRRLVSIQALRCTRFNAQTIPAAAASKLYIRVMAKIEASDGRAIATWPIALARRSDSPTEKVRPTLLSLARSGAQPHASDTMIGRLQASASLATRPQVSSPSEGKMRQSAAAYAAGISV